MGKVTRRGPTRSRGEGCRECCRRAALAAAVLAGAPVAADTVVVMPAKDNSIFDNGNSNGAGPDIFSGRTGPGPGGSITHRGLIQFDVCDNVPAGATITSASLTLTLTQASQFGVQQQHHLHRVTEDWGEGTSMGFTGSGAPPTTGDATWTHTFYDTDFWTTAGGDFEVVVSATQTVGTTLGGYTWGTTPEMVADVQLWLDDPSSNFGWILVLEDETAIFASRKFGSRQNFDDATRPRLEIEYVNSSCPWDCDGSDDGVVGVDDFLQVLTDWGVCGPCDFDGGGTDVDDFLAVLAHWGLCP